MTATAIKTKSVLIFSDFSHRKSGRAPTIDNRSPQGGDLYCLSLGAKNDLSTIGIKTATIVPGINILTQEEWEKVKLNKRAKALCKNSVYAVFPVVNPKGKTAIEKLIPNDQAISLKALELLSLVDEDTAKQWAREVVSTELKKAIEQKIKDVAFFDPANTNYYENEEEEDV